MYFCNIFSDIFPRKSQILLKLLTFSPDLGQGIHIIGFVYTHNWFCTWGRSAKRVVIAKSHSSYGCLKSMAAFSESESILKMLFFSPKTGQ